MNFRLYQPEDFPGLYGLEERCFAPPHRFSRRYMRSLVSRANSATWIAEEDGRLMGFAIAEWAQRKGETTAYIQTLEVDPEERRRGVGRELLGRIEGSALEAGAASMSLHVEAGNAAAIRLYGGQGYVCLGRRENYYPGDRAALIYTKRLEFSGLEEQDSAAASLDVK